MDKSYKCFFCKFDTGPIMTPNENCTDCKLGSNFELNARVPGVALQEWRKHLELDKIFEESGTELLDPQREMAHRLLVVSPCYSQIPPRAVSHELRALRQLFMEVVLAKSKDIKPFKKEKENEHQHQEIT